MQTSSNSYKAQDRKPKYAVAGLLLGAVAGITYYVNTRDNSAEVTNMQVAEPVAAEAAPVAAADPNAALLQQQQQMAQMAMMGYSPGSAYSMMQQQAMMNALTQNSQAGAANTGYLNTAGTLQQAQPVLGSTTQNQMYNAGSTASPLLAQPMMYSPMEPMSPMYNPLTGQMEVMQINPTTGAYETVPITAGTTIDPMTGQYVNPAPATAAVAAPAAGYVNMQAVAADPAAAAAVNPQQTLLQQQMQMQQEQAMYSMLASQTGMSYRYNPMTGEWEGVVENPMTGMVTATVAPTYDATTGAWVQPPAAVDPVTGLPQTDPLTGQPVAQAAPAPAVDPATGQPQMSYYQQQAMYSMLSDTTGMSYQYDPMTGGWNGIGVDPMTGMMAAQPAPAIDPLTGQFAGMQVNPLTGQLEMAPAAPAAAVAATPVVADTTVVAEAVAAPAVVNLQAMAVDPMTGLPATGGAFMDPTMNLELQTAMMEMQQEQMELEIEAQQEQYDMLSELTGQEYVYDEFTGTWGADLGENPMTGMPMTAPAPTFDAATGQWMETPLDPMTGQPAVDPVTGLPAAAVPSTNPMIVAAQQQMQMEADQVLYDQLSEQTGQEYVFDPMTNSWGVDMGENPMTGMPMTAPAPTYDAATGQWATPAPIDPVTGLPAVDPVTGLPAAGPVDPMLAMANQAMQQEQQMAQYSALGDMTGLSYMMDPMTGQWSSTTIDPMTGMMSVTAAPTYDAATGQWMEQPPVDPMTGLPAVDPLTGAPAAPTAMNIPDAATFAQQQAMYSMLAGVSGMSYQYNAATGGWDALQENPMTGMVMPTPAPTYDAVTGQWTQPPAAAVDPLTGLPVADPTLAGVATPVVADTVVVAEAAPALMI